MRCAAALALAAPLAALPAAAVAHDPYAAPFTWWAVLLPLALGTVVYATGVARRALGAGLDVRSVLRAGSFAAGIVLLATALAGPLDAWADVSFPAHMAQHMALLALAPPLLLAGRPYATFLRALPRALRLPVANARRWRISTALRRVTLSPGAAAALHGLLLWAWHAPVLFDAALRNELLHWLEHVTLLGGGIIYWRALRCARGAQLGWALAWTLVTVIHSGLLGALITLAPAPLYDMYLQRIGVAAALADQQLAGLVMWVPVGAMYLAAALWLAGRALSDHRGARLPDRRRAAAGGSRRPLRLPPVIVNTGTPHPTIRPNRGTGCR